MLFALLIIERFEFSNDLIRGKIMKKINILKIGISLFLISTLFSGCFMMGGMFFK